MSIRFDGKVAIVTGAGGGLGRSPALELARRGAKRSPTARRSRMTKASPTWSSRPWNSGAASTS